ncbi:hypothetical protein EIP91_011561 [Steccherinum ochraceum]|uniref:EthD domain-containing protein n=1 Tax=Steccherinum ochraceum TaxID=92696 RepID=A0A4R0RW00_9APHY|nr:hypothetical protein EIP91_011561 [Steccherinum ochraceum]
MSPPAYLVVFAEPGAGVSDELFNDWYNNEHVPLRVDTPTFKSWVRLEALDGKTPRYGAAYDLTSFEDTRIPPYTTLAETRSEREKKIFAASELFDRRIYDLYDQSPVTPPSSLFDPKKAAPVMLFMGLEIKEGAEDELLKYSLEVQIPLLSKCPGWVRSRLFRLREAGYVGVAAAKQKKSPCKYLAVHEWADGDFASRPEFQAAFNAPQREQIMGQVVDTEQRAFKLTKQWTKE